jgi:hypothetical protein
MNLKVRFTPDNRHPSMAFEAPNQSRSHGVLDHPLEPVIRLAESETRWRVTTSEQGAKSRFTRAK